MLLTNTSVYRRWNSVTGKSYPETIDKLCKEGRESRLLSRSTYQSVLVGTVFSEAFISVTFGSIDVMSWTGNSSLGALKQPPSLKIAVCAPMPHVKQIVIVLARRYGLPSKDVPRDEFWKFTTASNMDGPAEEPSPGYRYYSATLSFPSADALSYTTRKGTNSRKFGVCLDGTGSRAPTRTYQRSSATTRYKASRLTLN